MITSDIVQLLSKCRFSLENEKVLQQEVGNYFEDIDIYLFEREKRLDPKNIIDFYFEGFAIGMEIKIKGTKRGIYQQVCRYCEFQEIESLILLTNKAMVLPKLINNKPITIINLSTGWL